MIGAIEDSSSFKRFADNRKDFEITKKQEVQFAHCKKDLIWKLALKSIKQKDEFCSVFSEDITNHYSLVAELPSKLDIFTVENVDTE